MNRPDSKNFSTEAKGEGKELWARDNFKLRIKEKAEDSKEEGKLTQLDQFMSSHLILFAVVHMSKFPHSFLT